MSDYRKNFSREQIEISKKIIKNGSKLEKGVLSWCFQNDVPLKIIKDCYLLITYEQLVIEPEKVMKNIKKYLKLENSSKIFNRMSEPSWSVKGHSSKETQTFFNRNKNNIEKTYLIEKWRKYISKEEETKLFEILKCFNIDIYENGNLMPNKRYLLK